MPPPYNRWRAASVGTLELSVPDYFLFFFFFFERLNTNITISSSCLSSGLSSRVVATILPAADSRAASRPIWVDLPAPSPPSTVMNLPRALSGGYPKSDSPRVSPCVQSC